VRHQDTIDDFHAVGLKPPKVRKLGKTTSAVVSTYLVDGYQVAGAIWYETLRKKAPNNLGSNTFGDNHSVRWYGAFDAQGNRKADTLKPFWTDQLDPLCDGRVLPDGGLAKRGPQRLRRSAFVAAAGDVHYYDHGVPTGQTVGQGSILACAVGPARKLEVPPPDKDVDKTPLALAKKQIAQLQSTIDSINDALTGDSPLDEIRLILSDTLPPFDPKGGIESADDATEDQPVDDTDKAADKAKPVDDTGDDADGNP
jgi:hypothetical protein